MSSQEKPQQIDGAVLMRVCAGGVSQTLDGKMTPEVLTAIGTAANAYAALQRNEELENRVKRLEQQLMLRATISA